VIDLANETPIPLSKIPKRFPHLGRDGEEGGMRLCFSTVWRWVRKGVKGPGGQRVKLEALRLGGQLVTTEQALQRFAENLTLHAEVGPAQAATSRSQDKRRRASERAARELEEAGI
jgi:hypothetical protein